LPIWKKLFDCVGLWAILQHNQKLNKLEITAIVLSKKLDICCFVLHQESKKLRPK
jgi:hypothetical protein